MTVQITINSKFTANDLNRELKGLKRSPWSSKLRKDWPGFMWRHRRCKRGSIRIRKDKPLSSGYKRIKITAVGQDDAKLTSEFVEWILTHFGPKLKTMYITPR